MLDTLLGVAAVAIWLVGANWILSRHHRKRGTTLFAEFRPFRIPWTELEPSEQRAFGILALVSFALGLLAVSF